MKNDDTSNHPSNLHQITLEFLNNVTYGVRDFEIRVNFLTSETKILNYILEEITEDISICEILHNLAGFKLVCDYLLDHKISLKILKHLELLFHNLQVTNQFTKAEQIQQYLTCLLNLFKNSSISESDKIIDQLKVHPENPTKIIQKISLFRQTIQITNLNLQNSNFSTSMLSSKCVPKCVISNNTDPKINEHKINGIVDKIVVLCCSLGKF